LPHFRSPPPLPFCTTHHLITRVVCTGRSSRFLCTVLGTPVVCVLICLHRVSDQQCTRCLIPPHLLVTQAKPVPWSLKRQSESPLSSRYSSCGDDDASGASETYSRHKHIRLSPPLGDNGVPTPTQCESPELTRKRSSFSQSDLDMAFAHNGALSQLSAFGFGVREEHGTDTPEPSYFGRDRGVAHGLR
jgi:hypothetical protein